MSLPTEGRPLLVWLHLRVIQIAALVLLSDELVQRHLLPKAQAPPLASELLSNEAILQLLFKGVVPWLHVFNTAVNKALGCEIAINTQDLLRFSKLQL